MSTDQPVPYRQAFSQRASRLVLILALLVGLFHAWGGHDWLFGHHHRQLGEASYSTSSGYEEGQRVAQIVLTPFFPLGRLSLLVPLDDVALEPPISAVPVCSFPSLGKLDHPRPPPLVAV